MARALFAIGLLQVLTLIAGVLRAKGLAVALGMEGVGVISTVDQIVQMVTQLGAVGIPFTALKYMSLARSESAEAFKRVSAGFLRIMALLASAVTFISVAIVVIYPASVGAEMRGYVDAILLALLSVAPTMATVLLINVFAAAQRSGAAAALAFASVGAQAAAAVTGAFLGGIIGLYIATAAAGFLITVVALVLVDSKFGVSLFGQSASAAALVQDDKSILATALAVYISKIAYAGALLAVRYGVLAEAGEAAAGLLHAALTVALTAGSVLTAMSGFYLAPALNRAGAATDKIQLAHAFTGRVLALFMLGAAPLSLFPGVVISLLFTSSFQAGAAFVAGFLVWQLLFQAMNVYQQLLIGLNALRYMAFAGAAGLGVAAALSFVMIERAGPGGVSLALIAGAILSGAMMLARLRYQHNMSVPAPLVVRLFLILGTIGLAHALFRPETELQLVGFVARCAFAAVAYFLLLLQLTPSERQLLGKGLKAARALFNETAKRLVRKP